LSLPDLSEAWDFFSSYGLVALLGVAATYYYIRFKRAEADRLWYESELDKLEQTLEDAQRQYASEYLESQIMTLLAELREGELETAWQLVEVPEGADENGYHQLRKQAELLELPRRCLYNLSLALGLAHELIELAALKRLFKTHQSFLGQRSLAAFNAFLDLCKATLDSSDEVMARFASEQGMVLDRESVRAELHEALRSAHRILAPQPELVESQIYLLERVHEFAERYNLSLVAPRAIDRASS